MASGYHIGQQRYRLFLLSKKVLLDVTRLDQGFQQVVTVLTHGRWAVPEGIFGCHSWRRGATGTYQVEARDAAKRPTMLRTVLPPQRITQSQMSVVLRSRNPGLEESCQVERSVKGKKGQNYLASNNK